MSSLRKALEGVQMSSAAQGAVDAAEKRERDDASYIDYLESQLAASRKETPKQKSIYRQEWERTRSGGRPSGLEEVQEKILVYLAENEGAWVDNVARGVKVGSQVAQFHLDELQEKRMVSATYMVDAPAEWALDHEGRGYLIKHKLIG